MVDIEENIEGEGDLNRVVNSNREFLNKLAAIEKIDNCDQKVITINVLNAKVREFSIYVIISYRISSYSFRGNYSFLNLEIQRSQYIRPKITVHKCAETI